MSKPTKHLLLTGVLAWLGACEGGATLTPESEILAEVPTEGLGKQDVIGTTGIPRLPAPGGQGVLAPWGGADAARWRPEAILANASSAALNAAWSRASVSDAIVAIPTKMIGSEFYEFGDGQANAAPSFEWWQQKRPPVVATLIRFTASPTKVLFRFDRALPTNNSPAYQVFYRVGTSARTVALAATQTAEGDWTAEWAVPAELGWDSPLAQIVVFVHPAGWADWFPVWFRHPVRSISQLKATVPLAKQTFMDGKSIVDHEGVSLQTTPGTLGVLQRLQQHAFPVYYNQVPYGPGDIHAVFPFQGKNYVTGVGRGWTWVANTPAPPFKIMYTCFERRRQDLELSAPDGGVASGGGWHRIGDPAETILNDLEAGPIVVGSAMGNPAFPAQLPSGAFSYNLTDVATIRWLRKGEAFITPRGRWEQSGGTWFDRSNYHWYFFQQAQEVCTEEWVHPCVPNDRLDYTCN